MRGKKWLVQLNSKSTPFRNEGRVGKSFSELWKITFQVAREYFSPLFFIRTPVRSEKEARAISERGTIESLILVIDFEVLHFDLNPIPLLTVTKWS